MFQIYFGIHVGSFRDPFWSILGPGVHPNTIKIRVEFHIENIDTQILKRDDEVEISCAEQQIRRTLSAMAERPDWDKINEHIIVRAGRDSSNGLASIIFLYSTVS